MKQFFVSITALISIIFTACVSFATETAQELPSYVRTVYNITTPKGLVILAAISIVLAIAALIIFLVLYKVFINVGNTEETANENDADNTVKFANRD